MSRPPPTESPGIRTTDPGLSALFVASGDKEAIVHYASASVQEILGYTQEEAIAKSGYDLCHTDEIPLILEVHRRALTEEHCACVAYMRLKHRDGYFVECCVSYSVVYGVTVGMYSRAEDGPRTIQQALTAREVNEIYRGPQGRYHVKRWSRPSDKSRPQLTSTTSYAPPVDPSEGPWDLPSPTPRTFFLIDRFTDTGRVMYVSNDVLVNASSLKNQPFYSMIKPSDRNLVRQYMEAAKQWSPVIQNEQRSGGHGYAHFSVLKILDLPPHGALYPLGSDETERLMPGQEFIPVDGIFTASSDGLTCIISRSQPGAESGTSSEDRG